jgi:hypothetical protein
MDTQPENDVPETPEVKPTESIEKLSPQGIASMQGNDTTAPAPVMPEPESDISPPPDQPTPPPTDHRPTTPNQIESKESKNETVKHPDVEPGSLKYQPHGRGPESGG